MIIPIQEDLVILHHYKSKIIELTQSKDWIQWLRDIQNNSNNTVKSFAKSMERFWIWSLYNPTFENEQFPFYLSRYRKQLLKGFKIEEDIRIDNKIYKETIYKSIPMQKTTINKELAGIKSYIQYIGNLDLMVNQNTVNRKYENQKSKKSFLSSIGVKKSDFELELNGSRLDFIRPYKTKKQSSITQKYFPYEYFNLLIENAQPREKLIYILCGICSARIGQALNLTMYDIDYENKEIWLLDPKENDKDIYGNQRAKWLKREYNIDVLKDKPHCSPDLQFKYPIPLEHEPLTWLNEEYKDIFFDALLKYTKSKYFLPEAARTPRHPFLFTTSSGNRMRVSEINKRFKSSLRNIMYINNIQEDLTKYSLHSLRHMFGHSMANLYGYTNIESLIEITKNAMGHASLHSTMVYFNMDHKAKRNILQNAMDKLNIGVTNEE